MVIAGAGIPWVFRFFSSRVAKCHIFYTEQIFETKFYPMKSAQIATNLTPKFDEIEIVGYFTG